MNQNLTLIIEDQKVLYQNPKLKGLIGTQILSKIKEYAMTTGSFKIGNGDNPIIKGFVELELAIKATKEGTKEYKEALAKRDKYSIENATALVIASNMMGDPVLLFDILEMINKYYKITNVTLDDYSESDIIEIIFWILLEPKNNLETFLEVVRPLLPKVQDLTPQIKELAY